MTDTPDPSAVVTDAAAAFKAQMIRASAEAFVDLMVEKLLEADPTVNRIAAYREVAIQMTFNATVMFEALPEGMRTIFTDTLRGTTSG